MDTGYNTFQNDSKTDDPYKRLVGEAKDTYLQIGISVALGLFAFTTFCVCHDVLFLYIWLTRARSYEQDGLDFMPRARNKMAPPNPFLTYPIPFSAGCLRYGGSRKSRCLLQLAWTHMCFWLSSRWLSSSSLSAWCLPWSS